MKTKEQFSTLKTSWLRWGLVVVLIAVALFVCYPHRLKTIEAHSILQSGMKMEVQFTLESPWGWFAPDRVTDMKVSIGGRNIPVAKAAYDGLRPLDSMRKPVIAETKGFPEIIMWGAPKSTLTSAHWHFLNYDFSELDVVKNKERTVSYFSEPPRLLQGTRLAINDTSVHTIVIGKDSIKTASIKEQSK